MSRCLVALRASGIRKCSIFVFADNSVGHGFWRKNGWRERSDLQFMQRRTDAR